jgi:hypothetical protein
MRAMDGGLDRVFSTAFNNKMTFQFYWFVISIPPLVTGFKRSTASQDGVGAAGQETAA